MLNTDKAPTYAGAIAELKAEGKCPNETRHRQVKGSVRLPNFPRLGHQGPRHGWSWRTGAGRWSRIDPGQRLDQRSTLDAKVAAHGCLRHAIVQRSKNGI